MKVTTQGHFVEVVAIEKSSKLSALGSAMGRAKKGFVVLRVQLRTDDPGVTRGPFNDAKFKRIQKDCALDADGESLGPLAVERGLPARDVWTCFFGVREAATEFKLKFAGYPPIALRVNGP